MHNSVVIPCYNSSESLPKLVPELLQALRPHGSLEIILVNDSSPDQGATWEAINQLVDTHPGEVVGVDLARNFGEHHAVLAGLRESTGERVIVMDDDGQNPPEEVPKILAAFDEDTDVVYTRYPEKHHSAFRNLGSRFTNWVAGILMRKPSGLYLCSFKGMSRRLVDRIAKYPGSFPYIDGLVFRNTQRFKVIEVQHKVRELGASGYNLARLFRLYANMAFGFSILPLRIVTAAGISASALALVLGLWFLFEQLFGSSAPSGWASTAVLLTFFSGLILFALGVLGEYSGRLYLSTTGQKAYVLNTVKRGTQTAAVEPASVEDKAIAFVNLKAHFSANEAPIRAAIERVLQRGYYVLGPEVDAFEQELAAYMGGGHAVGVNSGTDAIVLSLLNEGIGAGDEVLTVATTAIPVPSAIHSVGAKPVYFDIDPKTWAPSKAAFEQAITSATRAVVLPHLYGKTFDLGPFVTVAKEKGLIVIEDTAQSFGAEIGGVRAGCTADYGAFSFYPTKTMGAFGDGGAIWVSSPEKAERLRSLRHYGQTGRYEATTTIARNSRLDEIQAAILRTKLTEIDADNQGRRELGKVIAATLDGALTLPAENPNGDHVYHLFVGLLPEGVSRDAFISRMKAEGVSCLVHYPRPLYKQTAFLDSAISLEVTEAVLQRIVSLPLYVGMDEGSAQRIALTTKRVLAELA